jgi:hypothetical protein
VHAVGPYQQAAVGRKRLHMARDPADRAGYRCIEQPQQVDPGDAEHSAAVDGNPGLAGGVTD